MCVNTNSRTKPVATSAALFVAALASASAQAAVQPTITVSGVVGSSTQAVDGYTGTVAFNTSTWLGKPYTLELTPDVTGVVKAVHSVPEIPGATLSIWEPLKVSYRLSINGSQVFAGIDNVFSELVSVNDLFVPTGTDLTDFPPGFSVGKTYDFYGLAFSGLDLGCFNGNIGGTNGVCDAPADIYEYGSIDFGYFWDVAVRNGIPDDNYPNPHSIVFENGQGMVYFTIGHFSPGVPGGDDRVYLPFTVTGVTVTPVPEPETWAMLLAGLGLVGVAATRRRV